MLINSRIRIYNACRRARDGDYVLLTPPPPVDGTHGGGIKMHAKSEKQDFSASARRSP